MRTDLHSHATAQTPGAGPGAPAPEGRRAGEADVVATEVMRRPGVERTAAAA